jgi:hypothetical protein
MIFIVRAGSIVASRVISREAAAPLSQRRLSLIKTFGWHGSGMAVLILLNILGGFFTYSSCSADDGKVFPKYSIPISTGVWHFTPHLNDFKRPANESK